MYLLGFDIGSSSVKAAIVHADTGKTVASVQSPSREMDIAAPQSGWAEQHPDMWWEHCCAAAKQALQRADIPGQAIAAIGIAYQMHGLVVTDAEGSVIRPSIIWCDSRAVGIGAQAYQQLGADYCNAHFLNAPGNFTASKLKWVKEYEPAAFSRVRYAMLPGDYIAFKMTGEATSTISGLSEGILWDFKAGAPAETLLDHYGIDRSVLPPIVPTFGLQGKLHAAAAAALGLAVGTPVAYRAGDQPNNALALNVLMPGEVAATGGTSGVVYGVTDRLVADPGNRINSFAHVNYTAEAPKIGVLLCINGAGSQYSWVRKHIAGADTPYDEMEQAARSVAPGSDGLCVIPFGNGAERMLNNRDTGAAVLDLQLNRHTRAHLYRATLEGIAFSFVYGMKVMQDLGMDVSVLRVGNDNLFQSAVFSQTISELMHCRIEMMRTNGAAGAAIAAGAGIGLWRDAREGLRVLDLAHVYEPKGMSAEYAPHYAHWEAQLINMVKT